MSIRRVQWGMGQRNIDRLSKCLRPIRSRREVSELMGFSETTVTELEISGLRKILRALTEYDEAPADNTEE